MALSQMTMSQAKIDLKHIIMEEIIFVVDRAVLGKVKGKIQYQLLKKSRKRASYMAGFLRQVDRKKPKFVKILGEAGFATFRSKAKAEMAGFLKMAKKGMEEWDMAMFLLKLVDHAEALLK